MASVISNGPAEPFSDQQLQLTSTFHGGVVNSNRSLGILRFSEAIAWTSIFSYVYGMIQPFKDQDGSRKNIMAVYAGLLVASFSFGEFVTGVGWGKVSTLIGRNSTLLLGVVGGMISSIL